MGRIHHKIFISSLGELSSFEKTFEEWKVLEESDELC